MLPSEWFRVLLFLVVVLFVYVDAMRALIRIAFLKFRGGPSRGVTLPWRDRISLGLALLGLGCMAYGYWVEPYWPEVTRVRITSPKIPKGSRPVRIVHISDLHCDPKPRLEERLPEIIAREQPDLIVFTGDSINSPAGLYVFQPLMKRLAHIAPTFVVWGNWDAWYWRMLDLYKQTGAVVVDARAERVTVNGAEIWVTGVPVAGEVRIPDALKSAPTNRFTVFLHHYPDEIEDVAGKADLYCAGHTHGGQVAMPFYGALATLSKYGKRFERGLHRVDGTWLYVNRGIGMEGGDVPRVRFCSRPEITVIEVVPE